VEPENIKHQTLTSSPSFFFFHPLAEPNNFNIVWTGVPLGGKLLVKGFASAGRINSFSLYKRGGLEGNSSGPTFVDVADLPLDEEGNFVVEMRELSEREKEGVRTPGVLDTCGWSRGFLAMRNYLVPPGTVVTTPRITDASDGSVVFESQKLVAGAFLFVSKLLPSPRFRQPLPIFLNSLRMHGYMLPYFRRRS
jgi:hypothetical protein